MDDTVDILLRWGASERTVDQQGSTSADVFTRLALGRVEAWAELERALELLARAPADRAWRRRCWLAMLRERTKKERDISVLAVVERAKKAGRSIILDDRERGDSKKARRRRGRGRGRGCGGAKAAVQTDLRGLVNVLVGLESKEVFRTIVGYIQDSRNAEGQTSGESRPGGTDAAIRSRGDEEFCSPADLASIWKRLIYGLIKPCPSGSSFGIYARPKAVERIDPAVVLAISTGTRELVVQVEQFISCKDRRTRPI
ncbi:unnamed protein product [Ectocarpus sp. 8 AP-2014]